MPVENMMTKVRVNNEIDLCEVSSEKVRKKIEAALQYARVSYFLRWQEPSFLRKIFLHEKTRLIFCINSAQVDDALRVFDELEFSEKEVRILGVKSFKHPYESGLV